MRQYTTLSLDFNYQMRNGSRTYLLNIEDPTLPMQSKLRQEACGEISAKEQNPMKIRIIESIDMKLCTWSRNHTIWTNNIHIGKKSIYVLKNVEKRYHKMPWCYKVPSNNSFLPTHFWSKNYETIYLKVTLNLSWQGKTKNHFNQLTTSSQISNLTFSMRAPLLL